MYNAPAMITHTQRHPPSPPQLPPTFSRRAAPGIALLAALLSWAATAGLLAQTAGEANRITDIRFWQSPEEAQIVVDLGAAPSRVSALGQLPDDTYFFDIADLHFRPGRQRYPLNNAALGVITFQEDGRGGVRVYFKVPTGIRPRLFVLPATAPKPDRVVLLLREPQERQLERELLNRAEADRLRLAGVQVVVLDPGHGGEDPGATHGGIVEKHLVLGVAKMVKAYFDRDPAFKAVLSRTGDYIIPLEQRPQIAEQLGAQVFVSIHANYNRRTALFGSEVYYESYRGAVGEAERLLAESENSQDALGGVETVAHPPTSKQAIVAAQASIMDRSRQLAEAIERRLATSPGLTSRGVRRAGFRVLHSLALPSVLVELAYTSNPGDAALLRNENARWRYAYAIYRGIRDFVFTRRQGGVDAAYIDYLQHAPANAGRGRGGSGQAYKIRAGDTLSSIAARFKVSVADLARANRLSRESRLRVGQTLRIPGGGRRR